MYFKSLQNYGTQEKVFRKAKLNLRNFILNYFYAATSTHLYKEMKIPLMLITEPHSFSLNTAGNKAGVPQATTAFTCHVLLPHDRSIFCQCC